MDLLYIHLGCEEFQFHYPTEDEGIAAVVKAIGAKNKSYCMTHIVWRIPDVNSYFQEELVQPEDKMDLLLDLLNVEIDLDQS